MTRAGIHIGTSGWHYRHWLGGFYPEDLASREFLAYYCRCFKSTEINSTFYRLPSEKTLVKWREETPEDFVFTMKASRYLTHMKKLRQAEEPLGLFLDRAAVLGPKLQVVLFQLPPKWRCNPERLQSFLDLLPGSYRYAFEFRDPSWFSQPVYEALHHKKAALCLYHLAGFQSPDILTADFVYVRLHGPGDSYQGKYRQEELRGWAEAFASWRSRGREIFCYFDNDEQGYAARDARELAAMLG